MSATMASTADATSTSSVSHAPAVRKRTLRHSLKIRFLVLRKRVQAAVLFGLMSAALYALLYYFNTDIKHIGEGVNQGDKTLFLLPIVLAFIFSLVHGIFTDRFWQAVGLKAKQ
jgi:hypothetical protein